MIFLIEDDEGNLFGGFISAKIDSYAKFDKKWQTKITDQNAFVFSLESNGRIEKPMKFEIKKPNDAFFCHVKSDNDLLSIGRDIHIYKKGNRTKCYCRQTTFDYHGINDALCGKTCLFGINAKVFHRSLQTIGVSSFGKGFNLERLLVIQME